MAALSQPFELEVVVKKKTTVRFLKAALGAKIQGGARKNKTESKQNRNRIKTGYKQDTNKIKTE